MGDFIVKLIPWIIPLFLLASWLANTGTPKFGGKKGSDKSSAKSSGGSGAEDSEAPSKVSESDMTDG